MSAIVNAHHDMGKKTLDIVPLTNAPVAVMVRPLQAFVSFLSLTNGYSGGRSANSPISPTEHSITTSILILYFKSPNGSEWTPFYDTSDLAIWSICKTGISSRFQKSAISAAHKVRYTFLAGICDSMASFAKIANPSRMPNWPSSRNTLHGPSNKPVRNTLRHFRKFKPLSERHNRDD